MAQEIGLNELRRNLKKSVRATLHKNDYLTREEAEELVNALVDEDAKPEEEEGELPEDVEEKGGYTHEELKENLPDDLWAEVKDHLHGPDEESAFEKAIRSVSGEGRDIPIVESDEPTGEDVSKAALSRFNHREEGSSGR